jgi:hypothetical protein
MQQHELFGWLVVEFAYTVPQRDGRVVVLRLGESRAVAEVARKSVSRMILCSRFSIGLSQRAEISCHDVG